MSASDRKIADVLARYGEPLDGNVWRVQGTAVIYHKALERIAAHAKIQFDPPTVIRAERDEAVVLVVGRLGEHTEWSFGEALVGTNYRVSGKQAAYVWAMAEKRAKDRVILKLIELSGDVFSEEEAEEFKETRPTSTPRSISSQDKAPALADLTFAEEQVAVIRRMMSVSSIDRFRSRPEVIRDFDQMSPEDKAWIESVCEAQRAVIESGAVLLTAG